MSEESFGRRLRRLRTERGLSQTQLAGSDLSPSYVSLLESGKRTATRPVVERLAERLGCEPRLLMDGVSEAAAAELELELRYAELALNAGDAADALTRFRDLTERDPGSTPPQVRVAARMGLARALEATGELEAAIALFDSVRRDAEASPDRSAWLPAVIALCGCYLEVGDHNRSVELGELARARLGDLGLAGTDIEVEALSTLVGCYQARGDLVQARLIAEEALQRAEAVGSRRARGAAYWNASLLSQNLGRPAEALVLAEKALALYTEGEDTRTLGRLRTAYAGVLLQQSPPRPAEAEPLLVAALQDLTDSGTEVELASAETELARARLALGRPQEAMELAAASLRRLGTEQRLEAARARIAHGQASLMLGDKKAALSSFERAAEDLSSIGASRESAAGWRELAELLSLLGRHQEASEAYRHALDAMGVVVPTAPVLVGG